MIEKYDPNTVCLKSAIKVYQPKTFKTFGTDDLIAQEFAVIIEIKDSDGEYYFIEPKERSLFWVSKGKCESQKRADIRNQDVLYVNKDRLGKVTVKDKSGEKLSRQSYDLFWETIKRKNDKE